jgi:phage terminase Nu1 subunit (DNA packaging protein)
MSQKEIARQLGVSEAAVSNWAKEGAPVAAGAEAVADWRARNKRAHISASQAVAERFNHPPGQIKRVAQAAESVSAAPPAADHISYEEARRRREVADALTAELRHREVCGELVQAIDVRASLAKRVVTFREGLLQIPDRLSAQLSAENDQGAIRRLLDVEIRATLAHLVEAM